MSRLQELLDELCPNGVEYKTIGEIATDIYRGSGIKRDEIIEEGIPCVRYGEIYTTYDIWFDECVSHTKEDVVASPKYFEHGDILFAITGESVEDIAKSCAYVGHDRCMAGGDIVVLKHNQNPKYLAYALSTNSACQQKSKGKVKSKVVHSSVPAIKGIRLPVPPLEVQREIVRVLDSFTLLLDELTDELSYRNTLFDELAYRLLVKNNNGEKRKIEEICEVEKGKSAIQKTLPGEYPLVVTTKERKSSETYQFDTRAVCIPLVSSRGHGVASLNHVYYQEGKFALGNILCAVIPKDEMVVMAKYLYYYFECTKDYILVPLMKGGANVAMHIPDIKNVKINVPSIAEQKKIINKLEVLEEYIKELLPKEIELRKLQNEYYRDRLLSFTEKEKK